VVQQSNGRVSPPPRLRPSLIRPRGPAVLRALTIRQLAALGVLAAGVEAVFNAGAREDPTRHHLIAHLAPAGLPSVANLLSILMGALLLALVPRLWRGTRVAVPLTMLVLCVLALLDLAKGLEYEEAALEGGLALLLLLGRRHFPLGSRNRPRPGLVWMGAGAWALAYLAVLLGPSGGIRPHTIRWVLHRAIREAFRVTLARPDARADWVPLIEVLLAGALAISLLTVRSALRPLGGREGHREHELRDARAIAQAHGEDSLSPFILRADKTFHFAAGGVLAYRVIGGTAVISGDPVGPPGSAPRVLESFLGLAHRRGWQVVVWGASPRHLRAYRRLKMAPVCAGQEAFVKPADFTLEGRRVRKLRQSVHRVERRGWQIEVRLGRDLDEGLEAEIDRVEAQWRASRRRLIGFAMSMGPYEPEIRPDDLYALARSPEGQLQGVMRFASHCGRLSLDAMRRIGETPNGLNEALVCRALEAARAQGVPEVSLNYAGLAHLARADGGSRPLLRWFRRLLLTALGRRFQLERLVRFNEKFDPEWRPRFLVYQSRTGLTRAILRVLQAEGYLPVPKWPQAAGWRRLPARVRRSAPANAAG
jgi:lysyl-tRNA synthetase class 2